MAKDDFENGVWRTVGGRRIFIRDGEDLETAMKKSGKFSKKEKDNKEEVKNNTNKELDKKIEDIRKSKKENLIVTDENGNIIHEELGNKYHTGYDDFDYKNTITYHNHPEGVAPYPSEQDFRTLEKTGMSKMVVVSKNYTFEYSLDEEYTGIGKQGLSNAIDIHNIEIGKMKQDLRQKVTEDFRNGKYSNSKEATADLNKQVTEQIIKKYQELAKNSGYKLVVKKIK